MKQKLIIFISLLVLIAGFVIGSFFVKQNKETKTLTNAQSNYDSFVRDYSVTIGSPDAKVTLVEFFDPACETCRVFYPHVKDIIAKYPGKIQLILRYAPFHQGADYFVRILEASRNQNMYWKTLETLYQTQHIWTVHHQAQPNLAWEVLKDTPLNLAQLKADMGSPKIEAILRQDLFDASLLKVQKTPSFFVNQKPLVNFGHAQLKKLVESEIHANYQE